MKRVFLGLTALTLVIMALVFNACEKQEIMENNQQEQLQTDATLQKILNFKNIVENPTKATGATMSIDSAVWYIEALLNFEYCVIEDSTEIYAENSNDSIIANVILENDRVSIQEIVDKYFEIENELQHQLSEIKETNKRVDIVDVTFEENQFKTYTFYNFGEQVFGSKYIWNITQDWHWGWKLYKNGTCDGQYVLQKDLTDAIRRWIGYNRGVLANVYWTNVSYNSKPYVCYDFEVGYPFPGGTTNSKIDISAFGGEMFFMLYPYEPTPDLKFPYCISVNECNSLAVKTNQAIDIIEDYKLPMGHKFKSIKDLYGSVKIRDDYTYAYIYHLLEIFHGIPHSLDPNQEK